MLNTKAIKPHQGFPEVIALAERLNIEPTEGLSPEIVIHCGPNGTGPKYDVTALIHAVLDCLDSATK